MTGNPPQEQVALDVAGSMGLGQKCLGQAARTLGNRRADHPREELDHDLRSPRRLD
jgi:hypothetical protein